METQIGDLKVVYSARGIGTYRIDLQHPGLRKHRTITGKDLSVVEQKVRLQVEDWAQKWAVVENRLAKENQKVIAADRTSEAQAELEKLEAILAHTLNVDDTVNWDSLKDRTQFARPKPMLEPPQPPAAEPDAARFAARLSLFDHLIPSRKENKRKAAAAQHESACMEWKKSLAASQEARRKREQEHAIDIATWEEERKAYAMAQEEANSAIERRKTMWESGDSDAVVEYCDLVLSNSSYPEWMPKEWELDFNDMTRTLIVEYRLPSVDMIPRVAEVRYIQSRDELIEKLLPDSQISKLYDSLVYQVALRTVHELFEADSVQTIDAIVFNGIVTSIDPRTGHETTSCILSMQAPKSEFTAINLAQVDPKACFKALKGVGSSKLHSLTPIAPILQLRREDGRFVSAREVANTLDESVNLAAMDWEDFEHLIRELFEHEFKSAGGEVKVTQASRDGGVDAVAFDPDPIRGGKIVIQAKRYTNTVGVAAVRDLYGTVMNEGATKGILVTTSDYGPDAYAFAKDKPLTLLNGGNLLHLLGKHGRKARIDIAEARRLADS